MIFFLTEIAARPGKATANSYKQKRDECLTHPFPFDIRSRLLGYDKFLCIEVAINIQFGKVNARSQVAAIGE